MTQSTETAPAARLPSPKERRRLREARSLTQEQVAAALGVTRETIKAWESGRVNPKRRQRAAYAKLLASLKDEPAPAPQATVPGGDVPGRSPQGVERSHRERDNAVPERSTTEETPRRGTDPDTPAQKAPALTPAQAFDALYAHSAPALLSQAYLLTGSRRLARESVEYAFRLAWRRWPAVATDRDPASWVRAAAYEYALSPWHRLRPAHKRPDRPPTDRDRRVLLKALLDLPPIYRRTLLLYDGLGLDLPDTAAETEASTPAAANRLLHARAAITRRLPELADAGTPAEQTALLQERLSKLAECATAPAANTKAKAVKLPPAGAVRTGSERKTRFWTRAALFFTAMIVSATGFTLVTAPTRYEPPRAPGQPVGGVPVRAGPQPLTPEDEELRDMLHSAPITGPARLVPQTR
ncbi:helix-turn-helix domain-containing protein [Streptomyces sp. ISL-100]|uniref:helix-turn-helix domain-containing protein n=1 Tax=Streptomyces sp. ISL-100 TaxID=2819173 RepID=UPI001BE7951B|nr:helix-turn-helix domain-containing protein [Streptomyces sp. ISL-100]MBT2396629.1 helix-turn-helix domain-containing protein [Streptomyces sp. ISL-100]